MRSHRVEAGPAGGQHRFGQRRPARAPRPGTAAAVPHCTKAKACCARGGWVTRGMGGGDSATAVPKVAVWHGSVLHCETANHPGSYYGQKGGRDVSNTYSAVHQALPLWSSRPKAKPSAKPKILNSDVTNLVFGEVAPHCSGVTSTNPFGLQRLCGTGPRLRLL